MHPFHCRADIEIGTVPSRRQLRPWESTHRTMAPVRPPKECTMIWVFLSCLPNVRPARRDASSFHGAQGTESVDSLHRELGCFPNLRCPFAALNPEISCGRGQRAMGPSKAMDEKDLSATQDGLAAKIREKNLCAEWCVGA